VICEKSYKRKLFSITEYTTNEKGVRKRNCNIYSWPH